MWEFEENVNALFARGEWANRCEYAAECDGYAGFVRAGGDGVDELVDAEREVGGGLLERLGFEGCAPEVEGCVGSFVQLSCAGR